MQEAPIGGGAEVEADQLLFRLDAREAQARVAQAEESMAAARARADDARRTAERMIALQERGAVSVSERDAAEAALAVAEADLQRAADALDEARTARSYSTHPRPVRCASGWIASSTPGGYGDAGHAHGPPVRSGPMAAGGERARIAGRTAAQPRSPGRATMPWTGPSGGSRNRAISDPGSRTFVGEVVGLPADPSLFPGRMMPLAIPVGVEERFLVPEDAVLRGHPVLSRVASPARCPAPSRPDRAAGGGRPDRDPQRPRARRTGPGSRRHLNL
ncbi:MAG: hypothetical protein U5R48_09000 [Gammaproteobacteria bacterium]|nr:hypothetical protein [Gammaproteobacteria bacterium]